MTAKKTKKPNLSVVEKEKEPTYIDVAQELAEFKRIEKEKLSTLQRNMSRIDMFKVVRDDACEFLHKDSISFDDTIDLLKFGDELCGKALECLESIDDESMADTKFNDPYEKLYVSAFDCSGDLAALKAWLTYEWIAPFGINLEKFYWDLRKRLGEPSEDGRE